MKKYLIYKKMVTELYIYTLYKCETCEKRQEYHNAIADALLSQNVQTVGIIFGDIEGARVEPYDRHEQLCRRKDKPDFYKNPAYIIETNKSIIALADPSTIGDSDQYIKYILDTISNNV